MVLLPFRHVHFVHGCSPILEGVQQYGEGCDGKEAKTCMVIEKVGAHCLGVFPFLFSEQGGLSLLAEGLFTPPGILVWVPHSWSTGTGDGCLFLLEPRRLRLEVHQTKTKVERLRHRVLQAPRAAQKIDMFTECEVLSQFLMYRRNRPKHLQRAPFALT